MSIPLQIYDFISILFPGFVTLMLIRIEKPSLFSWQLDNHYLTGAIFLVAAYICGSLLQGLVRIRAVGKLTKRISRLFINSSLYSGSNLRGRHHNPAASKRMQEEFVMLFKEYYDIDPDDLNQEEVFGLVYSPVAEKMTQRNLFVAIANFHRALCLISLSCLLYFLIKSFFYWPWCGLLWIEYVSIVATLALSTFVFASGGEYFKKLTDMVPFYAFVAWRKGNNKEANIRNIEG